jgi:2-desacetyl-2-hydroxyethyl bacteriochlorophyllide A dehydrogenase
MLAAQLIGAEDIRLAELSEPTPANGQLVVKVTACGICGSDLHTFRKPTITPLGRVLGHEFSGTVLSAPAVAGIEVGDRVVVRPQMPCHECEQCLSGQLHLCVRGPAGIIGYGYDGGFAERVLVPVALRDETVFLLPNTIDDRGGALIEPLSVGLRAVKQAGEVAGASVLVLGAGMIGLAVTQFLRLRGATAIAVADPSARRRDAAALLGADTVLDPRAVRVHEALPTAVDVVIDCAGSADALADGLLAVRPAGTVVLCAVYGRKVPVAPDWVVGKELTIRGSFAYLAEFPEVIAALAAGHIDPALFVSHELPLSDIKQAFETQLNTESSLKVLVRPNGA